jgi:hypothetical protein
MCQIACASRRAMSTSATSRLGESLVSPLAREHGENCA